MKVDISRLDSDAVSDSELADFHALRIAVGSSDMPEDPEPSLAIATARLRATHFIDGEVLRWAAYANGSMVGFAQVDLPEGVNAGLTRVEVVVHPAHRRHEVGIGLLRHVFPTVLDSGREVVIGAQVKPGSAGEAWSARLGFKVTNHRLIQALVLRDTDAERWNSPVAAGYTLRDWTGAAPAELLDSYAEARQALDDAPAGSSAYREDASWTPERVRRVERELIDEGTDEWVVVAVAEDTGQVVGLTQVQRSSHRNDLGFQMTTAVVAAHRGHRLGLAMKGRMMNVLAESWPELERIHTNTSAHNTHMVQTNVALGYRTLREYLRVETPTADLARSLERWR